MTDSAIAKGNTQNLINQFEGRKTDQPEADQSEAEAKTQGDQPQEQADQGCGFVREGALAESDT